MLVSLASGKSDRKNVGDNYNFYGINSGIMAMGGGTVIFSGVSSGDKINVNGTSHTIKGIKYK